MADSTENVAEASDQNVEAPGQPPAPPVEAEPPMELEPQVEPAASPAPVTVSAAETKVIYHIGSQDVPYLVKVLKDVENVTLGDFKAALNRPLANTKFFFKTIDEDIG